MKRRILAAAAAAAAAAVGLFAAPGTALASQGREDSGYARAPVLRIPGSSAPMIGDLVYAHGQSVYFSDQITRQIDVWNAKTGVFLGAMKNGFSGVVFGPGGVDHDRSGPDGLLVDDMGQIWAGNGDGSVKVGLANPPFTAIDSIATGSLMRADELAYDRRDRIIIVTNPAEAVPFVTLIDATPDAHGHHRVLRRIPIPGAAHDAIEQPAWDADSDTFLVAVGASGDFPNGEVVVINPLSRRFQSVLPLDRPCNPNGLALGPADDALLGCSTGAPMIINTRTGAIETSFDPKRDCCADEVWYNRADGRYYAAETGGPPGTPAPAVMVIDAKRRSFVTNLPIVVKDPPVFHAVAASFDESRVFVPEADGIHVFVGR